MDNYERNSPSNPTQILDIDPRDLMPRCIAGLTLYAALVRQKFGDAPEFDRSDDIRELIREIAMYWCLDDNSDEIADERFSKPFDGVLQEVALLEEPLTGNVELVLSGIFGLYRHAEDMTASQGADASDFIESVMDTMREMAEFYGLSAVNVEALCGRIDSLMDISEQTIC